MELAILDFLQKLHNPPLDALMCAVSALGDSGFIWILLGLLLLLKKKHRWEGLGLFLVLLGCLLIGNVFLKNLIARPRPCWFYPDLELLVPVPEDFSFPSGHTLAAFASAFYLWLGNKSWGRPALVLAALIGFSRMYLYVHYPTDVLAGLIIGLALAFGVRKLEPAWRKKTSSEA